MTQQKSKPSSGTGAGSTSTRAYGFWAFTVLVLVVRPLGHEAIGKHVAEPNPPNGRLVASEDALSGWSVSPPPGGCL